MEWFAIELLVFVLPLVLYWTIQAVIGGVISVIRWLIPGVSRANGQR